jgi:hypothetical protein
MNTITETPKRVQRQRVKGWTKPEGAVYVGRGSRYGNPFAWRTRAALARVPALDGSPWEYEGRISAHGMRHDYFHADGHVTRHDIRYMTRAEVVETFRTSLVTPTSELRIFLGWQDGISQGYLTPEIVRAELVGRDLMCWCPLNQPCHADVLLEIANGGAA